MGARGGSVPGTNPWAVKRASSAGSGLSTCTGTSQLAPSPLTLAAGWWSPTSSTTASRGRGRSSQSPSQR